MVKALILLVVAVVILPHDIGYSLAQDAVPIEEASPKVDPAPGIEPATDLPTPKPPSPRTDGLELIPSAEFFLDMFVERYKVPGGYQVRRFQGSEFFDSEKEKTLERRRKKYETSLDAAFYTDGLEATPLNKIRFPLRGVPYKITGFKTFKHRGARGFPAHKAYDVIVKEGTPVHPIANGIVVALERAWWQKVNNGVPIRADSRAWWNEVKLAERPVSMKSGNFVLIYHPPKKRSRSKGYYSFYAHLGESLPVDLGQIVTPDDVIGLVEHSGYNAMINGHGGHLHLSVAKDLGPGYLEPIRFAKYFRR